MEVITFIIINYFKLPNTELNRHYNNTTKPSYTEQLIRNNKKFKIKINFLTGQ